MKDKAEETFAGVLEGVRKNEKEFQIIGVRRMGYERTLEKNKLHQS